MRFPPEHTSRGIGDVMDQFCTLEDRGHDLFRGRGWKSPGEGTSEMDSVRLGQGAEAIESPSQNRGPNKQFYSHGSRERLFQH